MIRVAGVDVPRAAIAELAAKLHEAGETALADHIGVAIDEDYEALTLPDPIPELDKLRRVLHDARPGDPV